MRWVLLGAAVGLAWAWSTRVVPARADPIMEYAVEPGEEGAVIRFRQPMAVDSLAVSAVHSEVWGPGRQVRIAVARTASRSAVCGLQPGESFLEFRVMDPETRFIELSSLLSRPGATPALDEIRVSGKPASRRRLEVGLDRLSVLENAWQREHRCFCCHRLLPLALSVGEARARGLAIPAEALASMAAHLVRWQKPDGSFSFPQAPEYGVVTPTLCGTATLAWLKFLSPTLEPALLRGVTFLVSLQQPDGSLIPDFTFPPLMVGRPFAAWLFCHALGEVVSLLETRGYSTNPRLSWALQRVRAWLWGEVAADPERFLFAALADPEGIQRVTTGAVSPNDRLSELLQSLGQGGTTELSVLGECVRRRLGTLPQEAPAASTAAPLRTREATWHFLAGIVQEP